MFGNNLLIIILLGLPIIACVTGEGGLSQRGCREVFKSANCSDRSRPESNCPHCNPRQPEKWMVMQYDGVKHHFYCVNPNNGQKLGGTAKDLDDLHCEYF